MKLYNTLTRTVEELTPLQGDTFRLYSCGPTVYDHAHIGNLSAYVFADTLRRTLHTATNYDVKHVMNYTDVDDKTIRRSRETYADEEPRTALKKLTDTYIERFINDMQRIGNDIAAVTFVRATDTIDAMKDLITRLHKGGFAYIADDGVYFSIAAYQKSGKKYGQLLEINAKNTSEARIQNDEYDKESVHDFALWKVRKDGEPAWEFTLDGHDLAGRPGWHIECSVMSRQELDQPFDIHTGGVDLIFPHHENEIAQSTALEKNPMMAQFFAHNEHILVDGKKMAKSAQNFYTLEDVVKKGFDPLAFRLLILQAHYRTQVHFSWENMTACQNALTNFRHWADLQFQSFTSERLATNYQEALQEFKLELSNDLKTPGALAIFNGMVKRVDELGIDAGAIAQAITAIDQAFGLAFSERQDITTQQQKIISDREQARVAKEWAISDKLRDELASEGIGLRDTPQGAAWFRL